MTALPTTRLWWVASPGSESSCSTMTVAETSGCTLETTTAYCWAAALSDGETTALSRSTAKYSHPMFDRCADAWSQSCAHAPVRHAYPFETSHASESTH